MGRWWIVCATLNQMFSVVSMAFAGYYQFCLIRDYLLGCHDRAKRPWLEHGINHGLRGWNLTLKVGTPLVMFVLVLEICREKERFENRGIERGSASSSYLRKHPGSSYQHPCSGCYRNSWQAGGSAGTRRRLRRAVPRPPASHSCRFSSGLGSHHCQCTISWALEGSKLLAFVFPVSGFGIISLGYIVLNLRS